VGDYNLQINGVKTQDAGDYICQLGDQENRDQVHTVEILGNTFLCSSSFYLNIKCFYSTAHTEGPAT